MGDAVGVEATHNGRVVGFGTAGGKENLGGRGIQQLSHRFAGFLNGRPHFSPMRVNGRRITKLFGHQRKHGFQHIGVKPGSGGIV